MSSLKQPVRPLFLGIEGGGSHTVAILADANHNLVQRFEAGPANLRLLSDEQLLGMLETIAAALPGPDAVGIGMAGARLETDWERIRAAAAKVWPGISCHATNDLETALAAGGTKPGGESGTRVLVLSGNWLVLLWSQPPTARQRRLAAGDIFWATRAAVLKSGPARLEGGGLLF